MKNSSKIFKKHYLSENFNDSINALKKYCEDRNLQLTPLRRTVFEYLLTDNRVPRAYEILDMLGKEGFVHNIKRLAAFIGCTEPGNTHSPAFMIVRKCKKESVIEFIGICNPCHTMEAACL